MLRNARLIVIFCILTAAAPAPTVLMPASVVVFGASWCAPCRTELKNLYSLSRSAPMLTWVLAWDDDSLSQIPFHRPDNYRQVQGDATRALKRQVAPDTAGYPFAVMLDHKGVRCAQWSGPLSESALEKMLASCASAKFSKRSTKQARQMAGLKIAKTVQVDNLPPV